MRSNLVWKVDFGSMRGILKHCQEATGGPKRMIIECVG